MKIKILEKKPKPFKGSDGEMVNWFWYQTLGDDQVLREVGSNEDLKIGDEFERTVALVAGKKWYKFV